MKIERETFRAYVARRWDDFKYDAYTRKHFEGKRWAKTAAAWYLVRSIWLDVHCWLLGHDVAEELVSAEDGQSEIYCKRCGDCHRIQF